jgi:PST family polysaccharide transporter
MGVRTIATNGAMISIVGQFVRIATQAGSIVVLARILTPVDFGLLAMTYPIVLFATALQEAGLGMAVLQRKTIGDSELSTVFWISAAFGLGLAILLVLVSGPVADFYGDPRIESLLMASSALVVLGSLSSVPFAVLNRELRFVRMSIIDIVSLLAGFAVSVTAAIITQSYWALWLLSFTSALISFVMVWALCSWRPKKTLSFKGVKDLVAFGSNLTVFNLFNHVVRHIDNVLIGKIWGAEQLGFYDRAYKLMLLPVFLVNVPLKRVIVPLLVQARDEPDQYRKLYLGALQASLLLTVPPVVVVAAEPGKIIELLLGHGWAQSAPIFQWLSIVCILQLATTTLGWIFLTRNRARDMMIAGVISCILTCVFFVAGVKWGAQGVAIGYMAAEVLRTPFFVWWALKGSPISMRQIIGCLAPFVVSIAIGFVAVRLISDQGGIAGVLFAAAGVAASYLVTIGVLSLTSTGRLLLRRILKSLSDMTGARTLAGSGGTA